MITHTTRTTIPADSAELDLTDVRVTDVHVLSVLIQASWPGVGICDSCGRVIVRGMGRWWERGDIR